MPKKRKKKWSKKSNSQAAMSNDINEQRSRAINGLTDKIKGTAKERVGRMIGNDKLAAQGKTDQRVGKIKNHAKNLRHKAGQKTNFSS